MLHPLKRDSRGALLTFQEHVRVVGKEPFFSGTSKTSPLPFGHFIKITIELRFLFLNNQNDLNIIGGE
jgi:hypothetical protein